MILPDDSWSRTLVCSMLCWHMLSVTRPQESSWLRGPARHPTVHSQTSGIPVPRICCWQCNSIHIVIIIVCIHAYLAADQQVPGSILNFHNYQWFRNLNIYKIYFYKRILRIKQVKIYFIKLMSPSFLVKILCYTCRPFTNKLVSSAWYILAGCCQILKWLPRWRLWNLLI